MNIIILNGPPNSGKDHIADRLVQLTHGVKIDTLKFASPIKSAVHNILNIQTIGPDKLDIEKLKDTPLPQFFGKTPREAYIEFSEQYMKPMYGDDIFGKLLLQRIEDKVRYGYKSIVISDGGFDVEVIPLLNKYPNLRLIHLTRKGCDFSNDSRNYISNVKHTYTFRNNYNDPSMLDEMLKSLFIPYLTDGATGCFNNWLLNNQGK